MKSYFCFIFALFFAVVAPAQKPYFTIIEKNMGSGKPFPELQKKKAKKAAFKINSFLQLAILHHLLTNNKDSFQNTNTYKITENNERYIAIQFSDGNRLHQKDFLFNAATGDVIAIHEIFTPNGAATLRKWIVKKQNQSIAQYVQPAPEADYSKCLKNNIGDYSLNRNFITINSGDCYPDTFLKAHPNFFPLSTFAYTDFKNLLSVYGKALFFEEEKVKMKKFISNNTAGIYEGRWGTQPAILQIGAPQEKQLSATVYFNDIKTAIVLQGSFKNNRFEAENEKGKLSITISGGSVQGTWKAANSKVFEPINLIKK